MANKNEESLKEKAIPVLAYILLRTTNISYRMKVEGWQRVKESLEGGKSLIFSVWHGTLWVPAYFLKDSNLYALASLSQDGSYISKVLENLGWKMVRGSSSRGGSRSLLKLYRKLKKGGSTAITPDGPTGPRHKVKAGALFLQEKADSLLVPVGVDARWKKNFGSWDKFLLPLPFSKTAIVFGEPFSFEKELEMEEKQRILENKMEEVNSRAADLVKK